MAGTFAPMAVHSATPWLSAAVSISSVRDVDGSAGVSGSAAALSASLAVLVALVPDVVGVVDGVVVFTDVPSPPEIDPCAPPASGHEIDAGDALGEGDAAAAVVASARVDATSATTSAIDPTAFRIFRRVRDVDNSTSAKPPPTDTTLRNR